MSRPLSPRQRRMMAALHRGEVFGPGFTRDPAAASTTLSLRRRGWVHWNTAAGRLELLAAGREAFPLEAVLAALEAAHAAGRHAILSTITEALEPRSRRAGWRAVGDVLALLEDEGRVRGWNLEAGHLAGHAFDRYGAEPRPVREAYWLEFVPAHETSAELEAARGAR